MFGWPGGEDEHGAWLKEINHLALSSRPFFGGGDGGPRITHIVHGTEDKRYIMRFGGAVDSI